MHRAHFNGDGFALLTAHTRPQGLAGFPQGGLMQPAGHGVVTAEAAGLFGEREEDVLRNLLRQLMITNLPQGGVEDELEMPFHERGECALGALAVELADQGVVAHGRILFTH